MTIWRQRCELALERIQEIPKESQPLLWRDLFLETAEHLKRLYRLLRDIDDGSFAGLDCRQKHKLSCELWQYQPDFTLQPERFQIISRLLVYEWQGLIPAAYRQRWKPFILYAELYLQIYGTVQELAASPDALYHELWDILYWFYSDNSEIFCEEAAQLLFESDSEKERVLAVDRTDLKYLYESGCQIDAAVLARAQLMSDYTDDALTEYAHGLLCQATLPPADVLYLGFEPGMEALAARLICMLERQGKQVRLFAEQTFLPLRSPEFLRLGSVRIRTEETERAKEEYRILDPRYRERKIEVWKEACRKYPLSAKKAGVLIIKTTSGAASGGEAMHVSRAALRLAQEADEAINALLGERILLAEPVILPVF